MTAAKPSGSGSRSRSTSRRAVRVVLLAVEAEYDLPHRLARPPAHGRRDPLRARFVGVEREDLAADGERLGRALRQAPSRRRRGGPVPARRGRGARGWRRRPRRSGTGARGGRGTSRCCHRRAGPRRSAPRAPRPVPPRPRPSVAARPTSPAPRSSRRGLPFSSARRMVSARSRRAMWRVSGERNNTGGLTPRRSPNTPSRERRSRCRWHSAPAATLSSWSPAARTRSGCRTRLS